MINLPFASGKKYTVLGLGKSGFSSAAALQASGALVTVWDDKEEARTKAEEAGYNVADPMTQNFQHMAGLVVAPGVPFTHPTPHPVVAKARTAGIPILGDVALLMKACPEATFVGITGTNGKSTTTALIAHILKSAGRPMQVGGNLGTPVLTLDPLGKDGIYVIEMSSFQLDLTPTNSAFSVAVLLNITPDHFDRHGGLDGYIAAKKRLFRLSGPQTVVLGTDEPETQALFQELNQKSNLKIHEISVQHDVANGYSAAEKKLYHRTSNASSFVMDLAPLAALPGTHNAQNIAAAFAVCEALGLDRPSIMAGIKTFPGLAHRQQLVGTIGGVRFINDSKATNANAAGKALACYESIYWIAGGRAKAGGLSGLEPFMPNVHHAFLIGEAAEDFAAWCKGKIPFTHCKTLECAVKKAGEMAWRDALKGSVVLLSPACASYDQFSGYEERGDHFASLVRILPSPAEKQ